ncbi:MAG: helix-turn-helix domain-containing protein [Candidatus Acidiferrum sp.]
MEPNVIPAALGRRAPRPEASVRPAASKPRPASPGVNSAVDEVSDSWRRCLVDLPLSQIALAAGFSDQSHLARHFRRVTGMPPSLARRWS